MSQTFGESLSATLRAAAQAYAIGDQVAPCAVLWVDPERQWESLVPELQPMLPELFTLGSYAPEQRRGPALWLRCIEARVVAGAPPNGCAPIFYLPGVSQEKLRVAEDCPPELTPLVELQYRGMMWLHASGKEWTPYSFLVSKQDGLGLDVAKNQATRDALLGALPSLMTEQLSYLQGRRLDSEFFNGLVAPDATGLLLRWLTDPETFKQRRSDAEWKAFCGECKADFRFDPSSEGPLEAARQLASRGASWNLVWKRFAESPATYPGVVEWLKRAAPKKPTMFDSAEVWPTLNEREERELQQALESLVDSPQDEVIGRVNELEAQHASRRSYPWQKIGLSPFATALEPLAQLASLCGITPGAPTADAYGAFYASDGWRADAAALDTMAACEALEHHGAVLATIRAVYLPWLESTSRQLQQLVSNDQISISKRAKPIATTPGRIILFADGLRMDVAQKLAKKLAGAALECTQDWQWSTIPSVTATAKPAMSPIADKVEGGQTGEDFSTRLTSTGQTLTQDRFLNVLEGLGWQYLRASEIGDASLPAWTEGGTIDRRGHNEGWKLALSVEAEVRELCSRISALLRGGWNEVIVVTDHGWLLIPDGLEKVELKHFLAVNRWGRCAVLRAGAQTDLPTYKWQWNAEVAISTPPGAGCFRASTEYSHGGISLQEMVIPVLRVTAVASKGGLASIAEAKWTGARCRILVSGEYSGTRVDVRRESSDATSSLLADRQTREITDDGRVTVFLEDDSDIGKQAVIVLLDTSGQVIDALQTRIGD